MTPTDHDTNFAAATRNRLATAGLALLVLAAALAISGCTNNTPADTWVQQNQNDKNTRYVGGRISTNTIENVAVAWTADLAAANGFGAGAPGPLINENSVFIKTKAGPIVALDRYTGERQRGETIKVNDRKAPEWLEDNLAKITSEKNLEQVPLLTNTNVSEPEDGDRLVINSNPKGQIVALGLDSGNTEWIKQLEAPSGTAARVASSMAAANNDIFVPVANVPEDDNSESLDKVFNGLTKAKSSSGSLVSMSTKNGDVNWTRKLSSAPLGGATVVNNIVFVTTVDGKIYGFNRGNGDEVWSSALPAGSAAPIAASDDMVVVPASLVTRKGQKAQVVAFRIGGLGEIGGAEAPKIQQAEEGERAEATKPGGGEERSETGAEGKTVFVDNCGGCHTLADAGTSGNVGPNLDDLKPSKATVESVVTSGGAAMPAFEGTLSPEEITAVAQYVSSVAGP